MPSRSDLKVLSLIEETAILREAAERDFESISAEVQKTVRESHRLTEETLLQQERARQRLLDIRARLSAQLQRRDPKAVGTCYCKGRLWVCQRHAAIPLDECRCGAAAVPCSCNPNRIPPLGYARAGGASESWSSPRSIRWIGRANDDEARRQNEDSLRPKEHADRSAQAEHADAVHGAAGRVEELLALNAEIRKRKEAEEALRHAKKRYEALASIHADVPWQADPAGELFGPNLEQYEFTGTTEQQNRGEGWADSLHPDDRERVKALWRRAVETGTNYESRGRIWHAASQSYHHYIGRAVPIRNDDGTIREWIGATTDVHEQKSAEEALREADRRKDEFLATLSHELRNPLAAIVNALQIIRRSRDQQVQAGARNMMERQVGHMVRLVDDLLDVSRITRGKAQLRKEPVELATIMRNAVEVCVPLIESSGQELRVSMPPEPVLLDADSIRLAQIFSNLLNNAAKYSDPGAHIRFTAERRGNAVVVSVKDSGIGIAADMLPRVFDMFTQVHRDDGRSEKGLGIGLTLVKSLVEMHGGEIEARSDGLGKGSEFIVRLPLLVSALARAEG